MDRKTNGVQQYYQEIRNRLKNYIKSDYLANSETLLLYAEDILGNDCNDDINIAKEPYIETSSSYKKVIDGIKIADIPENVREVLLKLVNANLGIYSTPFEHQVRALTGALDGKDLFVSTGTGSGKTECFLWPIIAREVKEALDRPKDFSLPAVRTLIIYPMNALVSDQLARFRKIMGSEEFINIFTTSLGTERIPHFGMYTGRTPYSGESKKQTDHEKLILDYLSKTILSGVRPSELFLLQKLLTKKTFSVNEVQKELKRLLDYNITDLEMRESVKILQGCFTSKDEEYQKYKTIEIMDYDEKQGVRCFASYANCLLDNEFNTQVKDIINVGLARYRDKYAHGKVEQTPFVLYEKYSRRDVSLLMNCGKDMSSTMYGMSRIGDDVFIFITYHKEEAEEGKNYADGKPDYADAFEDNLIFKWDSQIGKDNSSPYMQKVLTAPRKHLLVKKSDAESSFYYMGQFDIIESVDSQKEDNSGKMKPIAKVTMKMHHPVREDLLRYLQSNISKENKAV